MATRGRKPTPTHLKLIHGNPGHRPIPLDQFTPIAKCPDCPTHLIGEARKEWDRVTAVLTGVISDCDRGALAMLCTSWARHLEAEQEMAKMAIAGGTGLLIKSPKGYPIQSPWLSISNRAHEMYSKMCVEFGLTPSSRTRVSKNASRTPEDIGRTSEGWGQF